MLLESPVIIPATLIAFADVLPPASAPRSVRAYVPGVPAPDELLLVKFPLDDPPHPVRTAAAATRIVGPRMPILSRVIKFGRDRPRPCENSDLEPHRGAWSSRLCAHKKTQRRLRRA